MKKEGYHMKNNNHLPLEPTAFKSDEVDQTYYHHIFDCINQICEEQRRTKMNEEGNEQEIDGDIERSNILSILGGRGSGKTSALLSIKKIIWDFHSDLHINETNPFYEYKKLFDSIYVLEKPIDPSIVIDSDNILKLILSLLFANYVRQKKIDQNIGYQKMIEQFIQLNKTINRLTKPDLDNDSLEDLLSSKDVFNLRESIRSLIASFLDSMSIHHDYRYLMIMIDDVDLNTKSCFEMLEQMRKYLSQDNVIIILSGNYDDFERVIQNEYIANYNKQYMSCEENHDLWKTIHANAEHYLIKVLPKLYRINANENAASLEKEERKRIHEKLKKIGLYLETNNADMKQMGEYIYGSSLRELIQFNNSIETEIGNSEKSEKKKTYEAIIRSLCPGKENLYTLSEYDLAQFDIQDALFMESSPKIRFAKLVTLIYKHKDSIQDIYDILSVKPNLFCNNIVGLTEIARKYKSDEIPSKEIYHYPSLYLWNLFDDADLKKNRLLLYIQSLEPMYSYKKGEINKEQYATSMYNLFQSYQLHKEAEFLRFLIWNLNASDLGRETIIVLQKTLTSEEKRNVIHYLDKLLLRKELVKSHTLIRRLHDIGGLAGKYDFLRIFYEAKEFNLVDQLDAAIEKNDQYQRTLERVIEILKDWYTKNA